MVWYQATKNTEGICLSTKEQVLAALAEAEEAVSGERLARKLGLSRNAVWKAVDQLRREGYAIEAVTNRGYMLSAEVRPVTEAGIRAHLDQPLLGGSIEVYDEIDSTNRRAKAWAAMGAPDGAVVCARRQSNGRGRFTRPFHSPMNGGAYFTVILRPKQPADRAVMLTSMAAVAVARAVERMTGVEAKIKWVNDVYLNGRKVCGILSEAGLDFETGTLEYAAVGIGINTARQEFPEDIRDIATSMGNETGVDPDPSAVIAQVLNEMAGLLPQLGDGGFMREYRARSNVLGRRVTVLRGDERFPAVAVDIDAEGSLIVQTENGPEKLRSGEISIRMGE